MTSRAGMAGLVVALLAATAVQAAGPDPMTDRDAFVQYFHDRFPAVALNDFASGPYAVDAGMRRQWQDIMQLPPYGFALDDGRALFGTAFADGKTYADCFPDAQAGIAQTYPRFDAAVGRVVTLAQAVNTCRAKHAAAALPDNGAALAALTAYITDLSRGKPIAVTVPDDPRARAAYADGRAAFYAASGPSGTSCASCHMQGAGPVPDHATRAPALGILAAFPVYASRSGEMKTAAKQIADCDASLQTAPASADPARIDNLEYFLTVMSDGIAIAGPGARP